MPDGTILKCQAKPFEEVQRKALVLIFKTTPTVQVGAWKK